jgi:hypothetical protein
VISEVPDFHGLIQHSFALQLAERRRPFRGRTNLERVSERFDCGSYQAREIGALVNFEESQSADHSPLGSHNLTTLGSLETTYVGSTPAPPLPDGLGWAAGTCRVDSGTYEEPRLVFADRFEDPRRASINDFLVAEEAPAEERQPISQLLLELMAHKRSRLFGFAQANRFVNVLLPHAVLRPADSCSESAWFMQPLVSFIRGGRIRERLRTTYSLTFFLIPVKQTPCGLFDERPISAEEIQQKVNPGWGFAATAREESAPPEISGSLLEYLSCLARFDLFEMRSGWRRKKPAGTAESRRGRFTLRQAVERVAFGVALALAQGRTGRADARTTGFIANDVVMSLGSARVSSVVVIDPALTADEVRAPVRWRAFPESLASLMKSLAEPPRTAEAWDADGRAARLDRPFVDSDAYAIGVLPTKHCVIVVSQDDVQCGTRESALMQAGSLAYMTIGAATAIGTLRAIDRRLEFLEGARPTKIAEIDRDIAADFAEIYDLDITRESYREIYRRLRERLGISRDYETLQNKMQALYRATSTVHEDKAQRVLAWLTAGIVGLSLLILIGTVVLVGNGH